MSDDNKKPFKFDLSVDPYKEINSKVASWLKSDKKLGKQIKPFTFSVDAVLDNRKWSKSKLSDELDGPAVWASKLFGTQAAQDMTAVEKGKKTKEEAFDSLSNSFAKAVKDVAKAQSLLLEEIIADKGDNKKALKDGKAALAKMAALDIKSMFGSFAKELEGGLEEILVAFDKLGKDQEKSDEIGAFQTAFQKDLRGVIGDFDKTTKEAQGAVAFLLCKGKEMANNKNVAPELQTFGKNILKSEDIFEAFLKDVTAFEKLLDQAATDTAAKSPDVGKLRKLLAELQAAGKGDKNAADVLQKTKELKKEFDKVAKDL